MSQQTMINRARQGSRAIDFLSGVISLAAVSGITAWTCTLATGAGVI